MLRGALFLWDAPQDLNCNPPSLRLGMPPRYTVVCINVGLVGNVEVSNLRGEGYDGEGTQDVALPHGERELGIHRGGNETGGGERLRNQGDPGAAIKHGVVNADANGKRVKAGSGGQREGVIEEESVDPAAKKRVGTTERYYFFDFHPFSPFLFGGDLII